MQLDRSKLTWLGKTYVTAGKAQEITLAEIEQSDPQSEPAITSGRVRSTSLARTGKGQGAEIA